MPSSVMKVAARSTTERRFLRRPPPASEATPTVRLGNHQLWILQHHPEGRSARRQFVFDQSLALDREFRRLTGEWQSATKYQSSVSAICSHPSYQRIIGMGPPVLPLILRELQQSPHLWFWALNAITGINPVSPEHRGRMDLMATDWIEWGRQQGSIES